MKKIFFTLLTALFCFYGSVAQNGCSKYYPFEQGTKFQITSKDKNDKPTAVIDYVVKESDGNTALLAYEMHDDKGELVLASEYGISCENDGISIDFNSLAAPGMMEQYKDMEIDVSGTNLFLPNNLSVGQTLPDADLLMNVSLNPINMKMTVRIFDRKVEGEETVTTPAGTFDCVILTQSTESKMGVKVSSSSREWYAPKVGMVKQESYNKKGKLIGKSVLTKFGD
ncbi:MAG: TapB family protein [Flavobacteriaceae bacterium]